MFDDFHSQHDIEALTRICQGLGRANPIVDCKPALLRMQPCGGDVLRSRVNADDHTAEPCQRLAQKTCTAADVEQAQSAKAGDLFGIASKYLKSASRR